MACQRELIHTGMACCIQLDCMLLYQELLFDAAALAEHGVVSAHEFDALPLTKFLSKNASTSCLDEGANRDLFVVFASELLWCSIFSSPVCLPLIDATPCSAAVSLPTAGPSRAAISFGELVQLCGSNMHGILFESCRNVGCY